MLVNDVKPFAGIYWARLGVRWIEPLHFENHLDVSSRDDPSDRQFLVPIASIAGDQ